MNVTQRIIDRMEYFIGRIINVFYVNIPNNMAYL